MEPNMTDHCSVCKRRLTDFTSRMIGIGPVCRAAYSLQKELGLENHAEFSVIYNTPFCVLIKDISHTYAKTVTNDVEYVLQKLNAILDIQNRRVFYIDSSGKQNEIVHSGGRFKCFKPARGITL
jgi:hypothetical protein